MCFVQSPEGGAAGYMSVINRVEEARFKEVNDLKKQKKQKFSGLRQNGKKSCFM